MQIRIGGVPEHFNLPWHLGLESGRFAAAGLDVSFHQFPTGTGSMCKALRHDEIDLAVALTEGLLMDIATHDQIRLLAPYVLSPLRWGIHVATDSPYQTEADLKDGTVAISRHGSGSHLMALLWAQSQGWLPEQLKLKVAGGLDALENSLLDKTADTFLWEVFTTLPRVRQGNLRKLGEFPTPWPCFMIACRHETAERPEIQTLLNVLFELTAECQQQADNTVAEVARRYDLSLDDARSWFAEVRWSTSSELPQASLDQTLMTLKELGLV